MVRRTPDGGRDEYRGLGMATRQRAAATTARRGRRQKGSGNGSESERRAEILAVAAKVFAEKGFASTTVRDIGDESGILSGSLYYHFASKEGMLLEILESTMDGLLADYLAIKDSTADARTRWRKLIEVVLEFTAKKPDAATILQNEFQRIKHLEPFGSLLDRYTKIRSVVWRDVLEQSVADGLIRPGFDLDMAYRIIMGAILSAVYWLKPDGRYTVHEIAEMYTVLLIDGLSRRPDSPDEPSLAGH